MKQWTLNDFISYICNSIVIETIFYIGIVLFCALLTQAIKNTFICIKYNPKNKNRNLSLLVINECYDIISRLVISTQKEIMEYLKQEDKSKISEEYKLIYLLRIKKQQSEQYSILDNLNFYEHNVCNEVNHKFDVSTLKQLIKTKEYFKLFK